MDSATAFICDGLSPHGKGTSKEAVHTRGGPGMLMSGGVDTRDKIFVKLRVQLVTETD